jgi:CRP/FNR family cyclic AMP-dependent transcriptional regulator
MSTQLSTQSVVSKRLDLLRNVPLFANITDTELASLLDDLRPKSYRKNQVIFHQGDPGQEMYIILKGKVRIIKVTPTGDETTLLIFAENDIFGEFAVIDGNPRAATARAIDDTQLLAMGKQEFTAHCQTIPELALAMARLLTGKIRWTAAYAEAVAQYDVAARLLHLILLYNEKFGEEQEMGGGYVLDLSMRHAELASLVGTRREWISRILKDWRNRGLIEYDSGKIIIPDLPKVQAERDRHIALTSSVW